MRVGFQVRSQAQLDPSGPWRATLPSLHHLGTQEVGFPSPTLDRHWLWPPVGGGGTSSSHHWLSFWL